MKLLGVDYGVARTGIAISDDLGFTAQGVKTVHSRKDEVIIEEIKNISQQYNIKTVILGFPKNMDNSVGERGEACLNLKSQIEEKTDLEVIMWDERLSTVSAINVLNTTNTRGKKRKNVVDTVAAAIILQNYLDYKRNNN